MQDYVTNYLANQVRDLEGPLYLRLVKALSHGVESGELRQGVLLPSQRALAQHLGLHFTTVTRAYSEARRRGLIAARRGRHTEVIAARSVLAEPRTEGLQSMVDLTSVWPPQLRIPMDLAAALLALGDESGAALFADRAGTRRKDSMGIPVSWLQGRFPVSVEGRMTSSSGARSALVALMQLKVRTNGILLTEDLLWPTVRDIAGVLGVKVVGVPMDQHGIIPAALEQAVTRTGATALYCVPNAQNPTNATMPIKRRREIARLAETHNLCIFEDDVYGELLDDAPSPIASLVPQHCYYIASFSKCLSPNLRVAYVVCPSPSATTELEDLLWLTRHSPAPIVEALVIHTMADRSAFKHMARVKTEIRIRAAITAELLKRYRDHICIGPLSVWINLPEAWPEKEFATALLAAGIAVRTSENFLAHGGVARNAVRVATGSARDQRELREALRIIVDRLGERVR